MDGGYWARTRLTSMVVLAKFRMRRRYLDFVSSMDDPSIPTKRLEKVTKRVRVNGRSDSGFNFFDAADRRLFEVILRGQHNISGMRNRDIRRHFPQLSPGQVSRRLKRLRTHGLIKRIGHTYKYYLTELGRTVAASGLKIRALTLLPQFAEKAPT